jgi:hypothetical protein
MMEFYADLKFQLEAGQAMGAIMTMEEALDYIDRLYPVVWSFVESLV